MLDQAKLKDQILEILNDTVPLALEKAMYATYNNNSKKAKESAKLFADTFKQIANESLAEGISAAIDYYVRNAEVFGQMMLMNLKTVGSPTSHISLPEIISASTKPVGVGGGAIPGINQFIFGIQ